MVDTDQKLRHGWCDVVANKLAECNPHCSFGFKRGWVPQRDSRKASCIILKAKAYCTFIDCQIICNITGIKVGQNIVLQVVFRGEVCHRRGERQARRIKSAQRDVIKAELAHSSPSAHSMPLLCIFISLIAPPCCRFTLMYVH